MSSHGKSVRRRLIFRGRAGSRSAVQPWPQRPYPAVSRPPGRLCRRIRSPCAAGRHRPSVPAAMRAVQVVEWLDNKLAGNAEMLFRHPGNRVAPARRRGDPALRHTGQNHQDLRRLAGRRRWRPTLAWEGRLGCRAAVTRDKSRMRATNSEWRQEGGGPRPTRMETPRRRWNRSQGVLSTHPKVKP